MNLFLHTPCTYIARQVFLILSASSSSLLQRKTHSGSSSPSWIRTSAPILPQEVLKWMLTPYCSRMRSKRTILSLRRNCSLIWVSSQCQSASPGSRRSLLVVFPMTISLGLGICSCSKVRVSNMTIHTGLTLRLGIPFLLRVGLAIVSFVRRQLLECTSEEAVLSMLHRPPLIRLPASPENYLSAALNVKLKDDDVRKQRVKLEAQVKRQVQQQAPRSAGSISLPRS